MSTHATLGVKLPDGRISGCYVHMDGDTMTPRIVDYVKRYSTTGLVVLIHRAQAVGGIRSFNVPKWAAYPRLSERPREGVTELMDNDDYIIDEINFYDDHMGSFAWYLVDYDTGSVEEKWKQWQP